MPCGGGSVLAVLAATFIYGVGVGVYQWFPYSELQTLYRATVDGTLERYPYRDGHATPDSELLRFAFTRDLSLPVLREPATSLGDILAFNESIHTPVERFFDSPDHIDILGARQLDIEDHAPVLVVEFLFDGRERRAYAYGTHQEGYDVAVLMIPGSGENKARRIVSGDPDAYHCCLYDALEGFDRFVLIKPNEGLRAVHDGVGRLQEEFFVNWHLNRGSSYSAAYVVEAVALTRFLSERSERLAIVGLSQGGGAALLTSLLEPPDALVVASGYSVLTEEQVRWSNHNQIIIPGMAALTAPEQVTARIDFPSLFTFGRQEIGIYGIDADIGQTCIVLDSSEFIECSSHDGGHVFPEAEVRAFLDRAFDIDTER